MPYQDIYPYTSYPINLPSPLSSPFYHCNMANVNQVPNSTGVFQHPTCVWFIEASVLLYYWLWEEINPKIPLPSPQKIFYHYFTSSFMLYENVLVTLRQCLLSRIFCTLKKVITGKRSHVCYNICVGYNNCVGYNICVGYICMATTFVLSSCCFNFLLLFGSINTHQWWVDPQCMNKECGWVGRQK